MPRKIKQRRSATAEKLLEYVLRHATERARNRLYGSTLPTTLALQGTKAQQDQLLEELTWLCETHGFDISNLCVRVDTDLHVASGLVAFFLACYGGTPGYIKDATTEVSPALKIALRDYQREALFAALNAPFKRGVISAPTGSGKTNIALAIIAKHPGQWTYIAPTRAILDQVEASRPIDLPIRCATWEDHSLPGYLFESAGVIIDEVHTAGTDRRVRILNYCKGARFGLSATPFDRSDVHGNSLVLGYVGPTIYHIDPARLQSQEYIASGEVR